MIERWIDAAVARYRTVFMLLAFIFIAGMGSYATIPKESSPDVQIPMIYISIRYEGISPEDAERLLLRPMEKKLQTIEGLKDMTSHAMEGFASIVLEFDAGFNPVKALDDVRVQVDEARAELPQNTEEPIVQEINFSLFPVVNVLLTGDIEQRTLLRIAKNLRDKIEGVSEVLEAKIVGDREESLDIIIDPSVLESYELTPQEAFTIVQNNNVLVPAGEMDTGTGSFGVKLPGIIRGIEDMRKLPLKVEGDAVVTLDEVATLRRGYKDIQQVARVNGHPAVAIAVSKRTGANIIETVAKVREIVEAEQPNWPQGMRVIFSQDTSNEIKSMLSDLENNVLFAIILVMIVVLAAMGVRNSLLVALSIPGSFLIGVLCIDLFGYTMNIVVLFSLILSVGMLVDAAIVVCEYADRRMMEGMHPSQAFPEAAKRMAWPIISSTLTTLIVFAPLLFWPGIVGQFMKFMPITLICVLAGSMIMALIFIPSVGARLKQQINIPADEIERTLAAERGEWHKLGGFVSGYVRLLNRLLRYPSRVVWGTAGAVAAVIVVFAVAGPGSEFFPAVEPENAKILVRAQGNRSVLEKDALVKQVEDRILPMREEIRVVYTTAGKFSQRDDVPEDLIGEIQLEFINWRFRRSAEEILTEIKQKTNDIPGVVIESQEQEQGPPTGKDIQLELASRFPELLEPALKEVLLAMKQIGDFRDIQDSLPIPEIEWEITVDRELAGRYGLDVLTIGNFVKMVTNGVIVTNYRPNDADDEVDIVLRFPEQYRNLNQLDQLRINTVTGERVPISNFIKRVAKQKITTLYRVDGKRVMTVKADVEPGVLPTEKVAQLEAYFREKGIDPRIEVRFRGEDEEQKEAGQFLSVAFLIALFSMSLLLVTQFNSVYAMLVIMSAVFFSTGGVLLGLLLTWQPFGVVMCGVAVIALAGVVVNNNIIFIDTFNELRREGVEVREALLRTGAQRLRPILLTAGTTVLGLIPMVFALNIDFLSRDVTFGAPSSQWWTQLSTAIAGGLTFATCLTLLFTPCLLLIGEKWLPRLQQKKWFNLGKLTWNRRISNF